MRPACWKNIVVASSEEAFYKAFDAATKSDPDPDATYEKTYGPFQKRIRNICLTEGVPVEAIEFFENWCPNRTRHVTVEQTFVTPRLLDHLVGLLTGDFEFWRIDVRVVDGVTSDTLVAQFGLWSDWVLCTGDWNRFARIDQSR